MWLIQRISGTSASIFLCSRERAASAPQSRSRLVSWVWSRMPECSRRALVCPSAVPRKMARMDLTLQRSSLTGNRNDAGSGAGLALIDRCFTVVLDVAEDVAEDLVGPLVRVDEGGDLGTVEF